MSIEPIQINLSFSSQESTFPQFHLPTQLNTYIQESVENKGVRESFNEGSDTEIPSSGLKRFTGSKNRIYLRRKKLKFIRPELSILKIPKSLAQGSQFCPFDFPKSVATDGNIEEVISEDTQVVSTSNLVNRRTSNSYRNGLSLFHQEKTFREVSRANNEVVKIVRKLMKEIKLIKRKYDKERLTVRKEFKYTEWMKLNKYPEIQQQISFLQTHREL